MQARHESEYRFYCRKDGLDVCGKSHDMESPYYRLLNPCIAGTRSKRWIPLESHRSWPPLARLNSVELEMHGNVNIVCFLIDPMFSHFHMQCGNKTIGLGILEKKIHLISIWIQKPLIPTYLQLALNTFFSIGCFCYISNYFGYFIEC